MAEQPKDKDQQPQQQAITRPMNFGKVQPTAPAMRFGLEPVERPEVHASVEAPKLPVNTHTGRYVAEALTGENVEDVPATLDGLAHQNTVETRNEQYDLAVGAMTDDSVPPAARVENARTQLAKAEEPGTPGKAFVKKGMRSLPAHIRARSAFAVDQALKNEENDDIQARMIADREDVTMDQIIEEPNDTVRELAKNLGDNGDFTWEDVHSLKDFIEYVNPESFEGTEDVDVDLGEAWDELTEEFTDDADGVWISQKFKDTMEHKYGSDWKMRFTAYVLKEVGIDAAILLGASFFPPLASVLFLKRATLVGKLGAVAARAATVGVVGTGIQVAQNKFIGDNANVAHEFVTRVGGELAGEALVKVAKVAWKAGKGLKGGIKEASTKFGEKNGVKYMQQADIDAINNPLVTPKTIGSEVARASLIADFREHRVLMNKIAKGIATKSDEARADVIKQSVAKLTGYKEDQLDFLMMAEKDAFQKLGIDPSRTRKISAKGLKFERDISAADNKIKALEKRYARSKKPETKQKIQEQIATYKESIKDLKGKIKAETSLTTGNELADRVLVGEAVGYRLMGETRYADTPVDDMVTTYLKDGTYNFRDVNATMPGVSLIGKPTAALKRWTRLTEPDQLPFSPVWKELFDADNRTAKFALVLNEAYKSALPGNIKGKERVFSALNAGGEEGVVYDAHTLMGRFDLNSTEVQSYYNVRKLLDYGHMLYDKSLVARMRTEGVTLGKGKDAKVLPRYGSYKGQPVQVVKRPANKIEKGKVEIEFLPRSDGTPRQREVIDQSALKELNSVIEAHTGYIPIHYKDASFHVTILDTKAGTAKRVVATGNRSDAITAAKELQAKYPDKVVVFNSWNQAGETGQVGIFKNQTNLIDVMDDEPFEALRDQLASQGVEAKQISVVMDLLGSANLRKPHVGSRAATRLTDGTGTEAATLPADQAIAEYFHTVSRRAGLGEWRSWAVAEFKKHYKDVLRPDKPWYDKDAIVTNTSVAKGAKNRRKLAQQAAIVQRNMRRVITQTTEAEKIVDNFYDRMGVAMSESDSAAVRGLNKVLERLPRAMRFGGPDMNNALRGVGSVPKLMFFNMAQFFVQSSQALATAGARPKHFPGAFKDLMMVGTRSLANQAREFSGKKVVSKFDGEAERLLAVLHRSGYVADVGTTDLMRTVRSGSIPGHASTAGEALRVVGRSARKISELPFRAGERTNRALAFLSARREAIEQAEKGLLKNINGNGPFKGKIDDDEFIRIVTDRAKITALNMTKAGQLELLSGHGSVLLQFKQVFPKFLNIFETSQLTGRQKLGAAAAMFGFWGPTAIPLMADVFEGVDLINYKLSGKEPTQRFVFQNMAANNAELFAEYISDMTPEEAESWGMDKEFYTRFLKRGALSALSDGEIDLVNRVALGRFVTDSTEMSQSVADYVVSFGVLADLVDAAATRGVLNPISWIELMARTATVDSYEEAWNNMLDGRNVKQSVIKNMTELGQAVSYAGSLARFIENNNGEAYGGTGLFNRQDHDPNFRALDDTQYNMFDTSTGRSTGVPVTKGRLQQYLLGITPGKLVERFTIEKLDNAYKEAVNEYRREQVRRFLEAPNPTEKTAIVRETLLEIQGLKALLAKENLKGTVAADYLRSTTEMFTKALINHQFGKTITVE